MFKAPCLVYCLAQLLSVCVSRVSCSATQCVAVCCSVLQCGEVCCSALLQCVAVLEVPCLVYCLAQLLSVCVSRVSCSVAQCVAVCCNVLQCVAVCCSVLQCVAECDAPCLVHRLTQLL